MWQHLLGGDSAAAATNHLLLPSECFKMSQGDMFLINTHHLNTSDNF